MFHLIKCVFLVSSYSISPIHLVVLTSVRCINTQHGKVYMLQIVKLLLVLKRIWLESIYHVTKFHFWSPVTLITWVSMEFIFRLRYFLNILSFFFVIILWKFVIFIACSQNIRYPKSVFFIISNEFCERFSYYGMRSK